MTNLTKKEISKQIKNSLKHNPQLTQITELPTNENAKMLDSVKLCNNISPTIHASGDSHNKYEQTTKKRFK